MSNLITNYNRLIKVKLTKSFPELPKGKYDAIKCNNTTYKLFANTGWWAVDKKYIKV